MKKEKMGGKYCKVLITIPLPLEDNNGISVHVRNLLRYFPKHIKPKVLDAKGIPLPFFSSMIIPVFSLRDLLFDDYCILHAHGLNFFSPISILIAKLRGKKTIFTVHGIPQFKGLKALLMFLYRLVFVPILKSADVVIRVDGNDFFGKDALFIGNGVGEEFFNCSKKFYEKKYVCYIGRIEKDKGVHLLKNISNKFNILLVGKNEGLLKELDFDYRHVEVSFDRIAKIYCEECRYVVLLSYYEGFPLVMLESIASHVPFFSRDVGCVKKVLKDLVGKHYDLFLVDEKNILTKLDYAEKNRELFEEILLRARKKAFKNYRWKDIAKKLVSIYEKIMVNF